MLNRLDWLELRKTLTNYKLQLAVTAIFFVMWVIFFGINPKGFSNPFTYTSWLSVAPFTILPALSLTFIFILREFDLSFPSIMGLGGWVLALTWVNTGPTILGPLLAVLVGFLAGLFDGVLVTKFKIPSLIATLGTMFLYRGIILLGTQGFSTPLGAYRESATSQALVGRALGVPLQMLWTIAVAILLWVFLNLHKFGAYIYYTGDNRLAAKMLGININKVINYTFAIHGAIAALAGVLATLEMATFWPDLGEIYLLKSVAAVVVGGTPLTGGIGSVFGSFMGGLILGLIEIGILAAGVTGFWIQVVFGLVIIFALIGQVYLRRSEK